MCPEQVNLRTKTAILALLGATSCQDGCWLADYTFVREGEIVTVYGYDVDESDACAGSFEGLDDYTKRIRDFLGVTSNDRYSYLWMSPEFFDGFCPQHASACARVNTVFTPSLPNMHEVTHVIAHEEWGLTVPLLSEGLATYLQEPLPWQAQIESDWVQPGHMRRMLSEPNPWNVPYELAGHFVSFLIETYGVEAFTGLYQRIPRESSLADWEVAVTKVYDLTLDDLLAEYADYPLCSDQQSRAKLWGCDGQPDYVFTPDDLEFEFEADCSDPRAMNWITHGIFITRLVKVTDATRIQAKVEIDGEPVSGPVFMAQECLPCSGLPQIIDETTDHWTFVYPGDYVIMLTLDSRIGSSIKLTLTAED